MPFNFRIGEAFVMMNGNEVALISTGSMLYKTMQIAYKLEKDGVRPLVLSMHTIKPIDKEIIIIASKVADIIVTIEEHSIIGGFGSAVAEVVTDNNLEVKLKRFGLKDSFCTEAGTQEELLEANGLTVEDIVREIKE
jgi:transketolase